MSEFILKSWVPGMIKRLLTALLVWCVLVTASHAAILSGPKATITVAPISIDIEWPHDGDHFCDSKIQVYGRVKSAARYKNAYVNDHYAPVDNGLFMLASLVELRPGANIIKVEAINLNDDLRTEKEISVFKDECEDWVELAQPTPYDKYSKIAPFDCTVRIIPHTTVPVNWTSASLEYSGPEAVAITRIKDDEFRVHIPAVGLYALNFQISDENSTVYQKQLFFNGKLDLDWSGLDEGIKVLEDSYLEFLKTMDPDTARQKVLERAKQNPDFSAGLNGKTIGIVHKGQITTLLDLPDP